MGLNELLDMAEVVTDKVVDTLKDAHYPGKVYDDPIPVQDAVIIKEEISVLFGAVKGPDDKGLYWHAFRGITNQTYCGRSIDPAKISQRKKPNHVATDFYVLCYGCVSRLTAFQTQATQLEFKELAGGDQ